MRSKIVVWGIVAAVALGVLHVIAALWNPVLALPQALILFGAAWGLHKRRSWSGYGAALFIVAVLCGSLLSAFGAPSGAAVAVPVLVYGICALLLFLSGRALGPVSVRAGLGWIGLTAFTLAMFAFVQPFVIPTGSMENTILIGDHLLVQRVAAGAPSRGDMVVFRPPGKREMLFVHRVVAVSGDRVKISNKKLFVNGAEQREPYARHKTEYIDSFRDNFPNEPYIAVSNEWAAAVRRSLASGEMTVPDDHVFVMGDNRDNSLDSRFLGFVPVQDIVGKPRMIYFSAESKDKPALLNPSSVRWGRMFSWL